MAEALQLLNAWGRPLSLDDSQPADLGRARPGEVSAPVKLGARNGGSGTIHFALVRARAHPGAQTGLGKETYAATEFALDERGDYAREADLGTLAPGEERAFWMRWRVPEGALPGARVWALEALGSSG